MSKTDNPYRDLPERAFWRRAVADKHYVDMDGLWDPIELSLTDRIATAGSCFAQHIGNNLAARGANFVDFEPAPSYFRDDAEARRFGFKVYSCRYGNIYTSRQLLQLFQEAFGERTPKEIVWAKGDRFYDALRPGTDPVGQASAQDVLDLRALHLAAVRKMFEETDLFVFTMGLTEGWESVEDNTMFPVAPGTICGTFDADKYRFHNLTYPEIREDMEAFRTALHKVNPNVRILLTVSPVPLTATATGGHVLPATIYSKSVLRAVAGDLANAHDEIAYFPSYEIIQSHPSMGMFFNPDKRTVNAYGVNYVMTHFFRDMETFSGVRAQDEEEVELICEEKQLDPINHPS